MTAGFENKKVIVAGGSSGIGLATAGLFLGSKARVTITGRNPEKLEKARQAWPGLESIVLDSRDRPALDRFFKEQGPVDHLVVALSGGKGAGAFRELRLDELRQGFEEKFWPQLHTVQAALPFLSPTGSITLLTAISSQAKLPGSAGLGAINGALEIMVPILARELKPVRVNAVSPGVVDTPWWDFLPGDVKRQTFEQYAAQIPVGRVAQPEEVANAIGFLAGNAYITGKVLACDGGIA